MDTRRFLIATLAGGVALYASGYVVFGLLLSDFYAANAGSAAGVPRASQIVWAVFLANFGYAALITYALGSRPEAVSLRGGAVAGAVVGFLLWFTVDLLFYGTTNISNLTITVADPLVELVHGAFGGAVIGAVMARLTSRTPKPVYAGV